MAARSPSEDKLPSTAGGENWGKGSSGSWRDTEVDTTQNYKNTPKQGIAISPSQDKLPGRHPHDPPLVVKKVKRGNRTPQKFVSLHHHSTFSYMDGYQMPEAHVERAAELNMGTLAMTEHGNVDSHTKLDIAAEKTGIKPIFGCEFYMPCPWEESGLGQRKTHLTVLAKNAVGYKNLLHLVSKSWVRQEEDPNGWYRYKPTVPMEGLVEHKDGLVILSGCAGSLLSCSVVGGKGLSPDKASYKRGLKVAREFVESFGQNYFIEVQGFPNLEDRCRANPVLARIAHTVGARLVGTMDCHYTTISEGQVQEILHNLRGQNGKQDAEDQDRAWSYDTGLCPPLSDGAILRKLMATGLTKAQAVAAIQSSVDIGEECTVTLPKLDAPEFPLPDGYTGDIRSYWREQIREGWAARGFDRLPVKERRRYKERLRYEVGLIEQKHYENYFLIVSDAILFLKGRGIPVGPARGSAAGSLVAYTLRITEVDPMLFPLLVFERFIDINRDDLPDIDIDLPSEVRDLGILRAYLETKYGSVANIGTFTYFKGKLALDDVARYGQVPKWEVENIKNFLIERSSGDLRASATVQDTIDQFPVAAEVVERYPVLRKAELLEGNVKGAAVHAAAYVVATGDIRDVTAVYRRKIKDVYADVVSLDKYDAERQGLLKIDFLGLSTMSALWDMCKWTGKSPEDLYKINIRDKKVYEQVFKTNDVTAIFQFAGRALRSVCQIVKPDTFDEVMACNALSRPGPLHNGAASAFAAIKFGQAQPERVHPALDAITEVTQFQIVYQEQIMRICRELGDFPWTSVAYIRKIISRKLGEQEFMRQWDRFWEGCQTIPDRLGYDPITKEQALSVWRDCVTSGSYAFNAAHCCAYGLLAFWTAYFKVYHPEAFFAASAKHYEKYEHDILRDAVRHNVKVLKPSIRHPQRTWEPAPPRAIRAGFQQIKDIGEKTADMIVEAGELRKWSDLINIKGIGPKTIANLKTWREQDDPFAIYELQNAIESVRSAIVAGELKDGELSLPEPTHNSRELDEADQGTHAVWIGRMVKKNIRDIFEVNAAKKGEALDPKDVKDPHLREFCIMYARDEDDQTMVKIDRWRWPRFKQIIFNLSPTDILVVSGRKPRYGIMANKIWVVDPN